MRASGFSETHWTLEGDAIRRLRSQVTSICSRADMHPSRLATNTTIWTLNTTIWTFGLVLQCVLVYVVFRRGIARRFPAFASLLVFRPVRAALLFGLSGHIRSGPAGLLYEVLAFTDDALQLMVAVEVGLHLIRGVRSVEGWTRFRALLCLLLLCAASVFTWITLVLVPGRISPDRLQLFAWFVLLALFGAVLKGSSSPNLRRISAGFAVFSLVQLSVLAGRTVAFHHRNAGQYAGWSYVPAVGYLGVVIFWLMTLREESERTLVPSELAR
jgi:hypothetical protein